MSYQDLRDFITPLEAPGDLRCISQPVSPYLEMTALCDRVLRASGPAILFDLGPGHHAGPEPAGAKPGHLPPPASGRVRPGANGGAPSA
jgi:hypothetical protein